jgi:hypothetical protein
MNTTDIPDTMMDGALSRHQAEVRAQIASFRCENTTQPDGAIVTWRVVLDHDRHFRAIPATVGGVTVAWWSEGVASLLADKNIVQVPISDPEVDLGLFEAEVQCPVPPWVTTDSDGIDPVGRYILKADLAGLIKAWVQTVTSP